MNGRTRLSKLRIFFLGCAAAWIFLTLLVVFVYQLDRPVNLDEAKPAPLPPTRQEEIQRISEEYLKMGLDRKKGLTTVEIRERLEGIIQLRDMLDQCDECYWLIRDVLAKYVRKEAPCTNINNGVCDEDFGESFRHVRDDVAKAVWVLAFGTDSEKEKDRRHIIDLSFTNLAGLNLNRVQWESWAPKSRAEASRQSRRHNLSFSKLKGVRMEEASLRGTDLRRSNLVNANLGGSDLTEVNLNDACLRFAILQDVDLTQALLVETDLIGAKLNGAKLIDATLDSAKLTGADVRDAEIGAASFFNATLCAANLKGVRAVGRIYATNAKFCPLSAEEASLQKLLLENNAVLCNVEECTFDRARYGDNCEEQTEKAQN